MEIIATYPLLNTLSLDIVAINYGIDDTLTVKYSTDNETFEVPIMYDMDGENHYFELHDTYFYLNEFIKVG